MRIGSAVGRNRAINFKRLWVDAFMGLSVDTSAKLWLPTHDGVTVTMICWGCSCKNDLRSFLGQVFEDKICIRLEFG